MEDSYFKLNWSPTYILPENLVSLILQYLQRILSGTSPNIRAIYSDYHYH